MSRHYSRSQSTLDRIYDIGGADLALRYHEISERSRVDPPAARPALRRAVFVNSVRIGDADVAALERAWRAAVGDGRYWYDAACGAWGVEGGPCAGFIQAGIALGGPLLANASGGGTGVYVNGRELHPQDALALARTMPVWPGRYWVDAAGNFGWEGGPALGNLLAAMRAP